MKPCGALISASSSVACQEPVSLNTQSRPAEPGRDCSP
jgi:hypothetical protein